MNTLNQSGINLIKSFEGCRLTAYPDPATNGVPWTIGYGHTGADVKHNTVWTQEQADGALVSDLSTFCSKLQNVLAVELNDNQFSALVSLVYNIGIGNFKSSTMLKCLNSTHLDQASDEFSKWANAGGHQMPGLLKRRLAEQKLFLTPA